MSRPVALITGARRGIGRAIGLALAQAGFDIAATDLVADAESDAACAAFASAGAEVLFHSHDVARVEGHAGLLDATRRRFGRLDCFVSNAGRGSVRRGDPLDLDLTHFDQVMDVNLRGALFLSQAAARAMLALSALTPSTQPIARSIIFITSVSAAMVSPERADYCVSKAGLSMWAKALALRLAAANVAVFEVRPGIIRTDMTAGVAAAYEARIADGLVPARRWGEGQDVARVVASLASGAFAFATGSIIAADGALSIPTL